MAALEIIGDPELAKYVRSVVANQWTISPEYTMAARSGAFLQGWREDGSWCLVEFWKEASAREFVDFVNTHYKAVNNGFR